MEIILPRSFDENSMYSFISQIIYEDNKPKSYKFDLNFQNLTFIKPPGVTILHNILQWLIKQGVKVEFITPKLPKYIDKRNAIKYLDDCGFFKLYLGEKLISYSSLRQTTIALKNVSCEEFYEWLENTLLCWLINSLSLPSKSGFSKVKTCLGEIFNNINDHSGENIGCVFAQHYPQVEKTIEIAISDFGIGIPNRIKEKFQCSNDSDALKLAIKDGLSTKSYPGNRGSGLNHLIAIVVESNKGSVKIYSNKGIIHVIHQPSSVDTNKNIRILQYDANRFYPGTLILITFNTDSLYEEIEEENFSW